MGIGCVVRSFAEESFEKGSLFELKLSNRITSYNVCYTKLLRCGIFVVGIGSSGIVVGVVGGSSVGTVLLV